MNGPEHYREAERLLISCQMPPRHVPGDDSEVYPPVGLGHEDDVDSCRNALMAAQVHATLALAAATAAQQATAYDGDEDHSRSRGWAGVA